MAADPFRFIDRWSTSVGDQLRRAFPVADEAALDMLLQRLEERDMALETYLQRWLAPISQVAASGPNVTGITTETTVVSATLPQVGAAGVWRVDAVTDVSFSAIVVGNIYFFKLKVGAATVDTVARVDGDQTLVRLVGILPVTEQQVKLSTAPASASVTVTRISGATSANVPADGTGFGSHNRVTATFIPNKEG